MLVHRDIQPVIEKQLFRGKVIILYGPRRVGKTTLSHQLLAGNEQSRYINCELLEHKSLLETTNSKNLKNALGSYRLVVLDEAQHIHDIGRILKIISDTLPEIQIIATGSSSFELGNKLSEPLTGRSREYLLLPFSIAEISSISDRISISADVDQLLRFGLYPEVYSKPEQDAIEELSQISSKYLYKDILEFEQIKRPALLVNLLNALALQIGHEVSLNELSRMLGETIPTIQRYIELLEKAFIIFRLRSFSRNLRKEIAKGQKIYFYDLGIRNALIRNFNPMKLRNDTGGLWENFCILERLKRNMNRRLFVNSWFWRTYDQKEVDYIEEEGGLITAVEFKLNARGAPKAQKIFQQTYPESVFMTITRDNFWDFVL
ncbi:MAG: ATP-binding protein [Bacteroidetes bacterium]|nr:ATP-binding protein [Bacteroidota bacterium]